jgi:hypothetical protein
MLNKIKSRSMKNQEYYNCHVKNDVDLIAALTASATRF